MSRFKVYIKSFDERGNYVADYTDITKYCTSLGNLSIDTDSSDFNIGIFRTSNIKLKLNNRSGLFSDVGSTSETLFLYKRADSKVKITYNYNDDGPFIGFSFVDEAYLGEEVTVFEGLLNDDTFLEDIRTEFVEFTVFGYENLFDREIVPYSLIANGDLVSTVLYTILNQTQITNFLTVSLANITPDTDQTIDDVSSFENKTVKEALDLLLNASNSVLYLSNNTIYIDSRDPGATVAYHFYGQSSQLGIENTVEISRISNGMNRLYNFIRWKDTGDAVQNATSVNKYGIKPRDVSYDFFTTQAKKLNILGAIRDEFGLPKKELEITTNLNYDTLNLNLLDRVDIDYPNVLIPWESNDMPICGVAICGSAVLPTGLFSLLIDQTVNWKIIKKELNFDSFNIKFKLRMI